MKFALILLLTFTYSINAQEAFVDNFSSPELKGRLAERGEWTFKDNTAFCISSEELYKKYNNHGPILKWPRPCTSGTIEFEMKVKDCSRFVFTLNGSGHIFRICLTDKGKATKWIKTRIIAWAERSSKQNKGETIIPEGIPHLNDINNQWTKVKISINGESCSLRIGDFQTSFTHKALGRKKTNIMASFAQGEFAIKNFSFTSVK